MARDAFYEQAGLWSTELSREEMEKLTAVVGLLPHSVQTLLDVGCGSGSVSNHLPSEIAITGIDGSEEALKLFRHKSVHGNVAQLPFPDKSFDCVLCADVLEHLRPADFAATVAEIKRVARRFVLVVTPNMEPLELAMTRCPDCACQFHVNWHMRSLDLQDLISHFSDPFVPVAHAYFGEPWEEIDPLLHRLRQQLGRDFRRFSLAVCPQCGSQADFQEQASAFEDRVRRFSAKMANRLTKRQDERAYSEVALLLRRSGSRMLPVEVLRHRSEGAGTAGPRLLVEIEPATGLEVPPPLACRVRLRHRGDINVGNPFETQDYIAHSPDRGFTVVTQHTDWSEPVLIDGRWCRQYYDRGGADGNALFVLPSLPVQGKMLSAIYKDTGSEAIFLEVFDIERGYRRLGSTVGSGTGRWEQVTVEIPNDLRWGREGIIFRFVCDREHPAHPHPIVRVFLHSPVDMSFPCPPTAEPRPRRKSWMYSYHVPFPPHMPEACYVAELEGGPIAAPARVTAYLEPASGAPLLMMGWSAVSEGEAWHHEMRIPHWYNSRMG